MVDLRHRVSSFDGVQVTSSGEPAGRPVKSCSSSASIAPDSPVTTSEILLERGHIFTSSRCSLRLTLDLSTCTLSPAPVTVSIAAAACAAARDQTREREDRSDEGRSERRRHNAGSISFRRRLQRAGTVTIASPDPPVLVSEK